MRLQWQNLIEKEMMIERKQQKLKQKPNIIKELIRAQNQN